jgi:hypothetical protein
MKCTAHAYDHCLPLVTAMFKSLWICAFSLWFYCIVLGHRKDFVFQLSFLLIHVQQRVYLLMCLICIVVLTVITLLLQLIVIMSYLCAVVNPIQSNACFGIGKVDNQRLQLYKYGEITGRESKITVFHGS